MIYKKIVKLTILVLTFSMIGSPVLTVAETISMIPENPPAQSSSDSSENDSKIIMDSEERNHHETNSITEDDESNNISEDLIRTDDIEMAEVIEATNGQTWQGAALRDFPLTVGYMGDMLRPHLIPNDIKIISENNSSVYNWVIDGIELGSAQPQTVQANSEYAIVDIFVDGSDRLVDLSYTPQTITPNGYRTNPNARWDSIGMGRLLQSSGEMKAVYSDDKTDVEGYMLVVLGGSHIRHSFSKEDLKGIVVSDFRGNESVAQITETEDEYTVLLNNTASHVGVIVPTTHWVDIRTSNNPSGHFLQFWGSLPGELEVWNPNFKLPILTGLKEENQFVSKYELTQEVPFLSSGEYRVSLEDNIEFFSVPTLTVINGDGEEVDVGNLVENEQGQTEIIFSAQEIVSLRGETVKMLIEYPLVTASQSDLEDYLDVDGYVSVPLSAQSNRMSEEVSATAYTWVEPWGDAVPQEVGLDTSTSELDPADYVTNLENKLVGDEPFAVGFTEARVFDTLGETSVGVIIESAISGIQNTIDVPVNVIENRGNVFVHHVDTEGKTLADSEDLIGIIGEAYETQPKMIENYRVFETPDNATGIYSKEDIDVTYVYEIAPVVPVDPLDPDNEVDPENPPTLPENQGLVSLDFVSQFNFGEVAINAGAKTYDALPQRLLNKDGTVNETEARPNYVQISDRREADNRGGWSLMARLSPEGFRNDANEELRGAAIHLGNQELAKPSANTGTNPEIVRSNGVNLLPGVTTRLLDATAAEGQGTWVYRFGDQDSAGSSVKLDVPTGANPKATSYQATINWELSVVPGN